MKKIYEKVLRYSDAYDDARKQRGWWYFTTHGVQPGSIPAGLNVLEVRDGMNKKGTQGTFVKLDGILNTSELNKYDITELVPVDESLKESLGEDPEEFYRADDGCWYKEIDSKQVLDSDEFLTDYTMYMKASPNNDKFEVSFVCVFGDTDLYRPEDGNYDFETNNIHEAEEWFHSYGVDPDYEEEFTYESLNTIPKALNRLDLKCIDEDLKYYDLRNLFEAVQDKLDPAKRQELRVALNDMNTAPSEIYKILSDDEEDE